jgi:calcium-binding protein CML
MTGYPPPGSGYPYGPGAGYGGDKPPKEGKTSSSSAPYAQPNPYGGSAGYGVPPGAQPNPYGGSAGYGVPPGAQPHPYGAPQYGDKPPKEGKASSSAPYYGAPPSSQPHPYGGSAGYGAAQQYGAPYGAPPPSSAPYGAPAPGGYGSPFAALVPSTFPPGTDPNAVASFQAADRDGSGMIDDKELQSALSGYNQAFSLRTVHLLMYLFTGTNIRRIGNSHAPPPSSVLSLLLCILARPAAP